MPERSPDFLALLLLGLGCCALTACGTAPSSPVDGGGDGASCTCLRIYPEGAGYCNCRQQIWGCMERPQRQVVCDVAPRCSTTVIDPETGCERPLVDPICEQSCTIVDPPSSDCDVNRIGRHCTYEGGECGGGMTCLHTDAEKGGVCVCECTPDDLLTPLVNEDTCPDLSRNVCGTVHLTDGSQKKFCFRRCDPALGRNGCTAPLICDPHFGALVDLPGSALCASFGCQQDEDCPVFTTRSCTPNTIGGCPAGERCQAISQDGAQGLCARAGVCDKTSGLCAPRYQNLTLGAQVGDPCRSDSDCDGNQRCEREGDLAQVAKAAGAPCFSDTDCCSARCEAGKCAAGLCPVHARNGYCVIEGCAFPTLPDYACPEGSRCNLRYPAGLCQRACSLEDASSCRGLAADRLGDYECRDLSTLSPGSDGPVCDFGDALRCSGVPGGDCAAVGLGGNATQMSCRALDGSVLVDPRSPDGLCLDDTAAGPGVP